MVLSTFLSIFAASIGFMASGFFAIGAMTMTSTKIFEISSTYWDANRHWGDSIADQRADYIIGGLLLLLSFSLQLSAILVPSNIRPSLLQPFGCAIAEIGSGIALILVLALWLRSAIAKSTKRKVHQLQDKEIEESQQEPSNRATS
jgi:hypothetical protein